MDQKVALVTGASSGFGRLTAIALHRKGYRVFGTSRKEKTTFPEGVEALVLDVRSDQTVKSCIDQLLTLANRLDLLVHAAETPSPRLRYRVGNDSLWVPRLKAVLPESWFRYGLRRRFNIQK